MQHHTKLTLLAAAGLLPFTAYAGDPGPMASYAPAPAADGECAEPGWTLELAALYLQVGASESEGDDGDTDFGYRAAISYETPSGLFFATRYFDYEGQLYDFSDGEVEVTNWDFLIGDTICCSDTLAVEIAGGLRYASSKEEYNDISGYGPVISIEAQRSLGGPWSLYAGITQAIIIGEDDEEDEDNAIYGITEIAAGVQYSFGLGAVSDAFVRLGGEGQYYYGGRDDDTEDFGLFGGALSVGFTF